ncbi:SPOR domain-containing protein [Phenylobacterium sp.]|uniref:SPOR domain-containing protein n=1 Tax=Phenylobacterium sp. TaxID=1871053 RepID=UPI002F410B95
MNRCALIGELSPAASPHGQPERTPKGCGARVEHPISTRAGRAAAVLAAALTAAGGARAADHFPATTDPEPVKAWLQGALGVRIPDLVALTPDTATSLATPFAPVAGSLQRLDLHAEALTPGAAQRAHALSWRLSLEIDCSGKLARAGDTIGYARRNLAGSSAVIRAADAGWRPLAAGALYDQAARRACPPAPPPLNAALAASPVAAVAGAPAPAAPGAPSATGGTPAAAAEASMAPPSPSWIAQLAAEPSEADAVEHLAALKPLLKGRLAWVEPVDARSHVWFRLLTGGFAERAEADAFCAQIAGWRQGCFVRRSRYSVETPAKAGTE